MNAPVTPTRIIRHDGSSSGPAEDLLVTEEPLELRLGHGPLDDRQEFRLSVTMRTPGHDEELALGFLYSEGIITSPHEIVRVRHCEHVEEEERGNVIRAELRPELEIDAQRWQRNFYTTSSCGVCGKSSLEAVKMECGRLQPFGAIDPKVITALPDTMRAAQTLFQHTGGIHAAALLQRTGELLLLREDIGRHNAVDKLIGAMLMNGISALDKILLVSGRAGFELVQKCIVSGISCMVAVGAPSSLSAQLAAETGLTLIGFLRGPRFNIYHP